jgi:hypothetical protein
MSDDAPAFCKECGDRICQAYREGYFIADVGDDLLNLTRAEILAFYEEEVFFIQGERGHDRQGRCGCSWTSCTEGNFCPDHEVLAFQDDFAFNLQEV